jgi:PAS domain S-box-containing protein
MKHEKRIKHLEEENSRLRAELEKYTSRNSGSPNEKSENKIVIGQDEDTLPSGILATGVDITGRQRVEAELFKTHELLKSITEGTDDMIAAQDMEFRYTFFNHAYRHEFRKLWGRDIEEGTSMEEAMARFPEELEKAKTLWNRALRGESFKVILDFGPEGNKHFYDLRFNPLKDEEGKIFGAAHILRDVTEQVRIQRALHESESNFRKLAESMPQLVFITGPDGYPHYFNRRWHEYTGKTFQESIEIFKSGWSGLIHPDDISNVTAAWDISVRTKAPFSFEFRMKKGDDGSYHWFLCRAMAVCNEQGDIVQWIGTTTDIQELKTAQQELQLSQEQYQLVNRATFDIIWDWDLATGSIEWNEGIEKATGRARSEAQDSIQDWKEQIHPDDRDRVFTSLQDAITSGKESWTSEYRFGPAGGPWRFYLDRGFIARDADGIAYRMVGTMVDLTDQKRTEERVRKSESLLQKVLEVLPVGVFMADDQGRIAQANPAAEKIWGGAMHVPIEQFAEYKGWWRNTGKRLGAEEWAFARAFLNGETSLDEEIDIECFDGTRKTILNSAVPVKNETGEIISAVAVVMDITEEIRVEKALRESEERFRTMADNIVPFAWMADSKGSIFWYNKRWFDYTGATPEEMQGWGWTKFHHPDHVDRVIEKAQHCLETGERFEDIFPLRGKDGNYRWFLTRAVPVRDEEGRIIRWFGTNTDVTEQRASEELLRQERELLQTIIDSIPVMITMFTPDLSDIRLNRAFTEITGWSGNAGKPLMELIFPDTRYRQKVANYTLSEEPGFRDVEMTTRDGRKIEAIWANVNISDDRKIGIGIDITQRKQMEEKLREQAVMLDQVQEAIVALDDTGAIRYMNDAAFQIYEIERRNDVLGTKPGDYFLVRWEDLFQEENIYKTLEETGTWKGENIHVTAKGKKIWMESVVSSIKDKEGNITGIISAMRDITERRKLEIALKHKADKERKAGELFENLLYIAAHDLKGPIANMYLALNLIDRIDEAEKKIDSLEIFRPLVNQLDFTIKGLTGILQVQKTDESLAGEVYFENVLNDVILEHRDSLYEGNVKYDFSKKPSIRYIEPFISSILKNLVNNAVKYSRDNAPLRIEVKTTLDKDGFVLLTVKDNGIGIDLEKHGEKLFTPFRRINPAKSEGTGIGLYMIKSIIEKNGGYIHMKSTPYKGSKFYCYLREYEKV